MGQKVVRFSDLSGKVVDEGRLVRVVVHEHPDLTAGPVEIEALAEELAAVEDVALDLVRFDIHHPGQDEPEQYVMEAATFDQLAMDTLMADILRSARRAPAGPPVAARPPQPAPEKINYATLEHAGKPHKGRTQDAEKTLVRDHLHQINQRLKAEGNRTIDLNNPDHVNRYALHTLAEEHRTPTD